MSKNPDPESKFILPPATRSALIISGILLAGITLATIGVSREALRIKRQRDAKAVEDLSPSGEMLWVPAGKFTMGANDGLPDELPIHDIKLNGFWIDKTEVTNEQFARFIEATHYVTMAERPATAVRAPGALTFTPPAKMPSAEETDSWWTFTPGANWQHPEGPASSLVGREKHPVVQVTWDDAQAYARWANKRLPTEAEWEFAARGGLNHNPFVWGREKMLDGHWMANLWQGTFPIENAVEDGFKGTAPTGSFPSNGYGLFDMAGNAAEWCADWYDGEFYAKSPRTDPKGPETAPGARGARVQRGGSYLCGDSYSKAYRPSARMQAPPDTARADIGFRCVRSGPAAP